MIRKFKRKQKCSDNLALPPFQLKANEKLMMKNGTICPHMPILLRKSKSFTVLLDIAEAVGVWSGSSLTKRRLCWVSWISSLRHHPPPKAGRQVGSNGQKVPGTCRGSGLSGAGERRMGTTCLKPRYISSCQVHGQKAICFSSGFWLWSFGKSKGLGGSFF